MCMTDGQTILSDGLGSDFQNPNRELGKFNDLRVHPPTQARESSRSDVVFFNVPTVHADEDLLYLLDPKPAKVERFKRRDGSISRTVKVTDDLENLQTPNLLSRYAKECPPPRILRCRRRCHEKNSKS